MLVANTLVLIFLINRTS